MNKVYKVIWNAVKHQYVVVSELAKRQGKSSVDTRRQDKLTMRTAAVLAALVLTTGFSGVAVQATDQAKDVKTEEAAVAAETPVYDAATAAYIKALQDAGVVGGTAVKATVDSLADGIAIGKDSQANDTGAIAIGANSSIATRSNDSIAIGTNAKVNQGQSIAVGTSSSVDGVYSLAIGSESNAKVDKGVALGGQTQAKAEGSVALGYGSIATDSYSVSVGSGIADSKDQFRRITNVADGELMNDAATYGQLFKFSKNVENAVGTLTFTDTNYLKNVTNLTDAATALDKAIKENAGSGTAGDTDYTKALKDAGVVGGTYNDAGKTPAANGSVAIGKDTKVYENAVAVGTASYASSTSIVVGNNSQAKTSQIVVLGNDVTASAMGATAIGSQSKVANGWNGTAIGWNSSSTGFGSVALGAGSVASDDMVVSVGNGGDPAKDNPLTATIAYRKIVNVADGNIETGSHDAVTGGQLFSKLGNVTFNGTNYLDKVTNLTDAATALDKAIKENAGSGAAGDTEYTTALKNAGVVGGTSGEKSIAVGNGSQAKQEGATAVGVSSVANGNGAVALGLGSAAGANATVAVGTGSIASKINTTAVGAGSQAMGEASTAIGWTSMATGNGSVALGVGSKSPDAYTVSVGSGDEKDASTFQYRKLVNVADGSIAAGSHDAVTGGQLFSKLGNVTFSGTNYLDKVTNLTDAATALDKAIKDNAGSGAAGDTEYTKALKDAGVVGGTAVKATVDSLADGIAIGKDSQANDTGAIAIGANSSIATRSNDSIAIGTNAKVNQGQSIAVGTSSSVDGVYSLAIGSESKALVDKGVALGGQTQAKAEGSVALGYGSIATDSYSVSVGSGIADSKDQFRRITNVADGELMNDAATYGQLFKFSKNVENAVGTLTFTDTNYLKNVTNLTDAATALDKAIKENAGSGAAGDTEYTKALKDAGVVGGRAYKNADEKVEGIAIGEGSNAATSGSIALGNKAIGLKGTVTIGAGAKTMGTDSIALGKDSVAMGKDSLALGNSTNARTEGTVALGTGSVASDNYTVSIGSGNAKDASTFQYRKLVNVADGNLAAGSHDAVTGGQLFSKLGNVTFSGTNYLDKVTNLTDAATALDKAIKDNAGSGVAGDTDYTKALKDAGVVGGTYNDEGKTPAANGSIAIGKDTKVYENAVAVGTASYASSTSIVVGNNSQAKTSQIVVLGNDVTASAMRATAIGSDSKVEKGWNGTAIGWNSSSTGLGSVALGAGSVASDDLVVSVGSGVEGDPLLGEIQYRKIVNVADGNIADGSHDAVTGGQLFSKLGDMNFSGSLAGKNLTDAIKELQTSGGSGTGTVEGAITYDNGGKDKTSVSFDNGGTALKNVTTLTGAGEASGSKVDLSKDGASLENGSSKVTAGSSGASLSYNDGTTSTGVTANKDGVTITGNTTIKGDLTIDGNTTITGTSGTANLGDIATNKQHIGDVGLYAASGITGTDGKAVTNVVDATIANKAIIGDGKLDNKDAKNLTEGVNQNYAAIQQNTAAIAQQNQTIGALGSAVNELDTRVDRVGAGAAALAALQPLDYDPDAKWDFAAGYGHYKGANAVAIGTYYRPSENTMFSVGGSFGGGENMVNAGVSFKIGSGSNGASTSRAVMAKTITGLQDTVQTLVSQNQQQANEIEELKAMVKKLTEDKK